jgi:hypothetical protein
MEISFELKEQENNNNNRLIIYINEKDLSYGFKCKNNELYPLYTLLREKFDGDHNFNDGQE